MVVAILMESNVKLSDDLLESIIDNVSVNHLHDLFAYFYWTSLTL